jgi:hypothetical protein
VIEETASSCTGVPLARFEGLLQMKPVAFGPER